MGLDPVLSLRHPTEDFMPPLITLWCQSFKHLIHLTVCSPSPYFFSFSMKIIWETSANRLPNAKADNIHWFPLIYQAYHFLLEYYQLLKPDFHLVNPCWLLLGTFLMYTCLEIVPQSSWSITFPRTDLRSEWPLASPPFCPSCSQGYNLKACFPVTVITEKLLGVAISDISQLPQHLCLWQGSQFA